MSITIWWCEWRFPEQHGLRAKLIKYRAWGVCYLEKVQCAHWNDLKETRCCCRHVDIQMSQHTVNAKRPSGLHWGLQTLHEYEWIITCSKVVAWSVQSAMNAVHHLLYTTIMKSSAAKLYTNEYTLYGGSKKSSSQPTAKSWLEMPEIPRKRRQTMTVHSLTTQISYAWVSRPGLRSAASMQPRWNSFRTDRGW